MRPFIYETIQFLVSFRQNRRSGHTCYKFVLKIIRLSQVWEKLLFSGKLEVACEVPQVVSPTINDGDKKFSISQNLTGFFVFFFTLSIMIDKKRSYKWPEATENTLMVAASSFASLLNKLGILECFVSFSDLMAS